MKVELEPYYMTNYDLPDFKQLDAEAIRDNSLLKLFSRSTHQFIELRTDDEKS